MSASVYATTRRPGVRGRCYHIYVSSLVAAEEEWMHTEDLARHRTLMDQADLPPGWLGPIVVDRDTDDGDPA